MKNITPLFVDTSFKLKVLFTKPLKYIIQLFTGDGSEHAALYFKENNKEYVFEMVGEGGFNAEERALIRTYDQAISEGMVIGDE